MKLRWLALFFAAFLLVSPMASADDGSSGSLAEVIEQIVAWLLGDAPPGAGTDLPSSDGHTSAQEQLESGVLYPPSG